MALEVKQLNIYAHFMRSVQAVVKDVGFSVRSGETLAIVGESGCGKTMIVNLLLGLLPDNCFATGEATLDSLDLIANGKRKRRLLGRDIVLIPQDGQDALNPSMKIKTQIFEALKRNGARLCRKELAALAASKLSAAGLDDGALDKYPFELSGGQAQRVAIAMAMCADPTLVIADEPTRGLDADSADVFWQCVSDSFCDAATIIVTHSIELAKKCDLTLVLKDGETQEQGLSKEVFSSPKSAYTAQLLAAHSAWTQTDGAL